MTTKTDVANMALAILDEAPIDALTDDNKAARLCNRHYDITYKAELTAYNWDFAISSDELTGVDTEVGDLHWEYALPHGMLRLLPLTYDNSRDGVPISYEVINGILYSDQESPRGIRYIEDIIDPTNWPALFVEVVAAALAVKLAHPLTHKASMVQVAQNAYDKALARALKVHARGGGKLYDRSWAYQRGDNRYWRA